MPRKLFFSWILSLFLGASALYSESPSILYLTWMHDPTSTMTIHWHSSHDEPSSKILYQRYDEDDNWHAIEGSSKTLMESSYLMHTVELTDLDSNTFYYFKFSEDGDIHRFCTLPQKLDRPVRFVVGGDVYLHLDLMRKMNRTVAKEYPDFVVIGGDIAYTNNYKPNLFKNKNWEINRWQTFLIEWTKSMIAPDGRIIPILVTVGNHDVKGRHDQKPQLLYEIFPMTEDKTSYRAVDFSNYLSLLLLDTGHISTVSGAQTEWLEKSLKQREDVLCRMAIYHVAAYPSSYTYTGSTPTKLRTHWVPLFEEYGLSAAFENHNHTYKLTHKIKNGKVDDDGVIYAGDGSWGASPRKPIAANKTWYLAKTAQVNCFWMVELTEKGAVMRSKDMKGSLLDEVEILPKVPSTK